MNYDDAGRKLSLSRLTAVAGSGPEEEWILPDRFAVKGTQKGVWYLMFRGGSYLDIGRTNWYVLRIKDGTPDDSWPRECHQVGLFVHADGLPRVVQLILKKEKD